MNQTQCVHSKWFASAQFILCSIVSSVDVTGCKVDQTWTIQYANRMQREQNLRFQHVVGRMLAIGEVPIERFKQIEINFLCIVMPL